MTNLAAGSSCRVKRATEEERGGIEGDEKGPKVGLCRLESGDEGEG